jgi:hypothetical protein
MSTNDQFFGRLQDNWRQRAREKTTFRDELRIIPRWLVRLLPFLYVCALASTEYVFLPRPHLMTRALEAASLTQQALGLAGIVTAAAVPISAILLLFGYVGADAKRRGMSPALWVVASIVIPYLIGVIIYFILREPLPFHCPGCGTTVNTRFNYCPKCQHNLRPNCPQCRREVRYGDRFCPHCGFSLESGAVAATLQTGTQAGAQPAG